VEAGPVDYRAPRRLGLTLCNRSITTASAGSMAWREYAGLVVYYQAGRTDTLFPAVNLAPG
jgi:hypothetical protein